MATNGWKNAIKIIQILQQVALEMISIRFFLRQSLVAEFNEVHFIERNHYLRKVEDEKKDLWRGEALNGSIMTHSFITIHRTID